MVMMSRKTRPSAAQSPAPQPVVQHPTQAPLVAPPWLRMDTSRQTRAAVSPEVTEDRYRYFEPRSPPGSALTPQGVQRKATVSSPGDPHEREADEMAARVMRMAEPTSIHSAPVELQRKCAACEEEEKTIHTKRAPASNAEAALDTGAALRAIEHGGEPLPASLRSYFEPRFGHDFSRVRVHIDDDAAQAVQARAYTVGQDIVFGQGEYAPDTTEGKHLLAHELTHVVQQSQSGGAVQPGLVQRQPAEEQSRGEAKPGPAACPPDATVDAILKKYQDMVAAARKDGYNVAADNLEHFLVGSGTKRVLSVAWLRSFSSLIDAERKNQERFEDSLYAIAKTLKHGDTKTFTDHWDKMFTASQFEELYYASGTSTIRSKGTFTLSCIENTIRIQGTVNHHWFDPYDWHAGLGAYIPGFGNISDEDALIIQQCRGAKPFDMEADWQQSLSGTVVINTFFNDKTYTWTGP
ncbi:DUF4157 domain-containing protein [Vitiosangium sp. GDMCC 1.1324]|uniref:eCIS core domain-containing protein n=1 Tax=Vitiosangium sp. (strain GDMCC 1.1324) TaxID=2138576 RepID=UPI000D361191|nr:DUF4157 domain-containing protein [Vitiosangium sp. GDMCC 1.1324]PTL78086.1 hypothetical protein DAT35_41465 [Vitiosangium sp. GDMCC 1.1324]